MKAICLRPECGRQVIARGLCNLCHAAANKLIKKGTLTWEQLEQEGKSIKPVRKVRDYNASNWLLGANKPKAPTHQEKIAIRLFDAFFKGYTESGGMDKVITWETYKKDTSRFAGWLEMASEVDRIVAESKGAVK